MIGILAAGAAVFGAWTLLLGAAFVCLVSNLRVGASVAIVLACYAVLAAAALVVLGTGWQGFAGAGGMMLPCAVAIALVALS